MLKKIGYLFLIIIGLLVITGIVGVKWFNNMWFKERPNHLTFISDSNPIDFEWAEGTYGDHFEPHAAILIPVRIEGMPNKFYLQFDTGAPSTMIYGKSLKSFKEFGLDASEVVINEEPYMKNLNCFLGANKVNMQTLEILENYGDSFDRNDTISEIKIGTIGADFLDNRITLIDFKNKQIRLYLERPKWMNDSLPAFKPFDFKGRRLMLPANIDDKESALFYDSGSSSFGLITSKNRYDKYTNKNTEEISYNANRFGEPMPIHHKYSDKKIEIGGANLDLKRISYIDMYADYQKYMTPFTKIGGWLGNKPFTESTMIIDTQKQEFIVFENPVY